MDPRFTDRPRRSHAGIVPGVILVAIGALFLLNNLQIFPFHDVWRFWPAILIAAGMVKLVDSTYSGGRIAGAILVAVGGILLAQTLGFVYVRLHDLWPLILIAVGVVLLFQRTMHWPMWGSCSPKASAGMVQGVAVFGGGKRVIVDPDFKGGEISAIFGGYEIDLRKASMQGDSAVFELNVVFGGVEMRIPETWSAVVEGAGIFGAFTDETVHPDERIPGLKRLILRGAAVFGGVVVKN
jgi:Domain of unknown function (DUF5668)/Cell wall-active antibiotics response 4TMS YvqF